MSLKAEQPSLSPEELPYCIEDLLCLGERMTTRSGTAVVTRFQQLGAELLVWADYGSGIEQVHVRERATCDLKIVLGGKVTDSILIADTSLVVDPLAPNFDGKEIAFSSEPAAEKTVLGGDADRPLPETPKFESKACGWIGWKETKRERKKRDPWVCRQAWLYWEEPGGKKRSRYIPKAKLADVEESVYVLKRPIRETLELLRKRADNG